MRHRVSGDLIRGGGTAGLDSPSFTSTAEREIPTFNEKAAPRLEVVIGRSAMGRITDDLYEHQRSSDKECGGIVYGPQFNSWHKEIRVTGVTRTWDAVRASGAIVLDSEAWDATRGAIAHEGRDEVLLGTWHTHTGTSEDRPSDADLRCWLGLLDYEESRGRSQVHLGLIFTEGRNGWISPRCRAWVVTRRHGFAYCEPATIRKRR